MNSKKPVQSMFFSFCENCHLKRRRLNPAIVVAGIIWVFLSKILTCDEKFPIADNTHYNDHILKSEMLGQFYLRVLDHLLREGIGDHKGIINTMKYYSVPRIISVFSFPPPPPPPPRMTLFLTIHLSWGKPHFGPKYHTPDMASRASAM